MGNPENIDLPPPYSVVTGEYEKNSALVSQNNVLGEKRNLEVQTVQQIIHVGNPAVGPKPAILICPSCHETIQTKVEKKTSSDAHLACLFMALFGLGLCCWVPYCMKSCKNMHHSCPHCDAYIGKYINN